TVCVSNYLASGFKWKDHRKAALRGCPDWMRWLMYGFYGYIVVNLLLSVAGGPLAGDGGGANAPPEVFRLFSLFWMFGYASAAATLYPAIAVARSAPARRCPNGHRVLPPAGFCELCGAAVADHEIAGAER